MKRPREHDESEPESKRARTQTDESTHFLQLPREMRDEVRSHLPRRARIQLSRTCRVLHQEDGARARVREPIAFARLRETLTDLCESESRHLLLRESQCFMIALAERGIADWHGYEERLVYVGDRVFRAWRGGSRPVWTIVAYWDTSDDTALYWQDGAIWVGTVCQVQINLPPILLTAEQLEKHHAWFIASAPLAPALMKWA
jgi:hypothetical protein